MIKIVKEIEQSKPSYFNPLDRTWGFEEAAEYLGCTPLTLRVWTSKRRVPFCKVGRLTRFMKRDLDAHLERQRVPVA